MTPQHALHDGPTDWAHLRVKAGLSIADLATLAGLPRSVVGLICQGRLIPRAAEAAALWLALRPMPDGQDPETWWAYWGIKR